MHLLYHALAPITWTVTGSISFWMKNSLQSQHVSEIVANTIRRNILITQTLICPLDTFSTGVWMHQFQASPTLQITMIQRILHLISSAMAQYCVGLTLTPKTLPLLFAFCSFMVWPPFLSSNSLLTHYVSRKIWWWWTMLACDMGSRNHHTAPCGCAFCISICYFLSLQY